MPMKVGDSRAYIVRFPFFGSVEPIEVVRRTSVAGAAGFELRGPMGMSRLAWVGDRLLADNLTHSRFAPAIPLLALGALDRPVAWNGVIRLLNTNLEAKAVLDQDEATEEVLGRPIPGIKSVLRIEIPRLERVVSVESTFLYGIGLVRQVQRTNDSQDIEIRLLAGS